MPVTFQVDTLRRIIRTQSRGDVTFEEVVDHFRVLERQPQCPRQLNVLLDLSRLTSLPESDQLRVVSDEVGRIADTVQFEACA